MSLRLLAVFSITELVLCLTPGPAVLLIVSQSLKDGLRASLRGALGILAGNTIYFVLSALGLGALLLASATLFNIIKWAGAAYLVVMGLKMLFAKRRTEGADRDNAQPKRSVRLFSEGLLTQLSNPKAIVFFSALLPQFISPDGGVVQQLVVLGVISLAVELAVLSSYGWLAERGSKLIHNARFSSVPDRIAGGFLIGAGVSLAAIRRM